MGISLAFSCLPFRLARRQKGNCPRKSSGWWGRVLSAWQGDQNLTGSSRELSKDEGCGKPVNTEHLWWFFYTPIAYAGRLTATVKSWSKWSGLLVFPFQYFNLLFIFFLLFFFLVVLSGVKQTNNQTKSWLILGGRGMTAAWFHQWELCSRLHQSLVLSAWGRRDHAALLGTRKSCNPSSEYQTLGCWKGLIIGPELTKFNDSLSFTTAIPGSWSSLYQHF